MLKSGMSMLLSFFFVTVLVSFCSAYDPPDGGDSSSPGEYEPSDYQDRASDSQLPDGEVGREPHHFSPQDEPPPAGEVGPAPSHDDVPYDYNPPPTGAVGPARYR